MDATAALYSAHETACIDQPCTIGRGTRIGPFAHVMQGATIGENCELGHGAVVAPNATIGNNVKIGDNVSVCDGVVLEDDVFCGPSVAFMSRLNPRSEYLRGLSLVSGPQCLAPSMGPSPCAEPPGDVPPTSPDSPLKPTLIKRGATLGANSTILCGRTVREYAMVGAGTVVTRDVLRYAVVVGVPAREIGWACRCGTGRLDFKGSAIACCPACARHYRLQHHHGLYEISLEEERASDDQVRRTQKVEYGPFIGSPRGV